MVFFNIFLFALLFIYLCNWFQIHIFLSQYLYKKNKLRQIKDPGLVKLVRDKADLKICKIYIFKSEKMFAMMVGVPFHPHLVLSKSLYEKFNPQELEWVVLHEAGHCVGWHMLKALLLQISFLFLGVFIIYYYLSFFLVAIILAITFSSIFIYLARILEREAEDFAVRRVSNPREMIKAAQKIYTYHSSDSLIYLKRLLGWKVPLQVRIDIARNELNRRAK